MTWNHGYPVLSGLNGDVALLPLPGANVAINSNWIDLDFTANSNDASVRLFYPAGIGSDRSPLIIQTGGLYVITFECALSGAPTQSFGIFGGFDVSNVWHDYFRINTSKQVECLDYAGTLLATSSSTVSTAKASPTKIHIVIDVGFHDTSKVYLWLVFGGTEDANVKGFDTGLTPNDYTNNSNQTIQRVGRVLGASNPGITFSFRNLVVRETATAGDAPYTAAYPDLTVVGGQVSLPPAADDTFTWTNSTSGAGLRHNDVDDYPTNDGDTTSIWDSQTTDPKTAHDYYGHYTAANPLGASDTVLFAQFQFLGHLLGGGKNFCYHQIKVGTSVAQVFGNGATPSTSYAPYFQHYDVNPSTSAAWAETDFAAGNILFGAQSIVGAGLDTGPRITTLTGPEIVKYSSSLSVLSSPGTTGPPGGGVVPTRRRFGWVA